MIWSNTLTPRTDGFIKCPAEGSPQSIKSLPLPCLWLNIERCITCSTLLFIGRPQISYTCNSKLVLKFISDIVSIQRNLTWTSLVVMCIHSLHNLSFNLLSFSQSHTASLSTYLNRLLLQTTPTSQHNRTNLIKYLDVLS